jgi:CDGSH-type Zn-finger protein
MAGSRITVNKNGPLRVEGDFVLLDSQDKVYGLGGRTAIALCRCGQSQNKPFCDGAHKRVGFVAEEVARELPAPVTKPPAAAG